VDTTAPALIITGDSRPKVTGDQLVLSFSDTGNLDADASHKPANGAFTVLVNGVANAVTNVAIESQAKTVTLTLTTAVTSDQTVTVAYADPTTGNDANAIQDATGNDAASFAATAVTNNTPAPADTTAPALIITGDSRPKVTGDQLVLSFSDTGNLDADASHKPASGAFTVLVNGIANAVTNVTVEPQAKTVTLTLSTAVTHDQTVTVAYADPTTGNDANAIQDATGNDTASFAATAVTNNTPAPADTTAPALIIIGDSRPKVTGDQLVLSFSDTGNLDADTTHTPANGAFTVLVDSVANAVTNVAINAEAKTVTLTLTTAVTSDQSVTVAYADPTTGNDANAIQDAAGNDTASFAATAVTNNTPAPADTTAPALIITGDSRPKVTGDQLVLSFSDTGNLDADAAHKPANGAFTVLINGVANAVTSVTVEPQAKTVTLMLSTAVTSDQTVTVAYADPTTGNDANAIQDAAGNDATSFAATAVTNNTPAPADTTAPALIITGDSRPKVTGDQLVLSFSDTGNLDADTTHTPANGAFTVLVDSVANAVTNVAINAEAKTVTLTLTTAVTNDQTVTVAYADPTTGNDANAIQNAAGNDATSFQAISVDNHTPAPADTTAPQLIITGDSRPKVTGNQLVLSFSDTGNLDADASHKPASGAFTVLVNSVANAVTNVAINAEAKTVTLTLTTAVTSDQTVTIAYADPTTGNDANAIQDAAGNDAASFAATAVTNNTPAPADTTAPQLIITGDTTRPKVNGNQLVLSFSDTGNLDADPIHTPANGAFTVLVDSVANAVTNVAINAEAKTVTLTLTTAVTSDQTVTVAYADPTTGNDANAIQDAAGNDATSFAATAVTNNTPAPADTAAPALIITGDSRPKVTGDQLVLSFSDTGNLDADASHKPASGAFTVLVNGVANAVTNVAIEPQAKTVTLTLSTAVTSDQTVTVAYADPTTGNDANAIQDAAGNDTPSFAATAVTNNTPAPADTTAPQLIITGDSRPKVTGDQLVLSFSDTGNLDADLAHKPANGAFTVLVNGVANAVTNVTVDSQAKTVTLTLTTAVTSDQTVTVAYADPTTGNDANAIQDAAGNDAASFAATAVTNNTPAPADTTAPALIITGDTTRPKVNGNQLVLSFSDTGNLDADPTHTPANGAFTVMVNGVANAVTNVAIESQAKTVTLTLTTAVTHGQSVTVAYADPTTGNDANAIQDATGNDAASFAATAVTNNTPAPADNTAPEFSSAAVNGSQLVLTYTEANTLDPAVLAGNAGFTVNTAAGTAAITVNSAVVSATAKTVTLTLSRAVTSAETVTVSYTKPSSGAVVQDAAGNDAVDFNSRAVTNTTPRVPNEELTVDITIADSALTAGETTTFTFTFSEPVNGFDASDIVCTSGTLSTPATNAARTVWTATFTPTANINVPSNVINIDLARVTDNAGNPGKGETTSANYSVDTRDTVAPLLRSATVNGDQLVLTYTEANTLNGAALTGNAGFTVSTTTGTAIPVNSASVNATAKTVTLTLSRAAANGEALTVSYAKPATGGVQDAAGNQAVDFSNQTITNTTPDTTPPVISSAAVNGDKLVLTYTEANTLNGATLAGNAGFTVSTTAGTAITVNSASVNTTAKTVTLTLSRAAANGETLTVSYAKPATGGIQDAAGNQAVDFSNQTITNTTPDTTPPVISSAAVNGNQLVLTYTEANTLNGATLAGNAGFTVSTTAGTAIAVSSAVVDPTTKTVTLTLSRAVTHAETVTVGYAKPATGGVQDAAGNNAANFGSQAVTNNTPAPDTTPPVINAATVNGDQLVLSYTEANSLNGAALAGNAGFTVSSTAGPAITVTSAVVHATAKTVTLTLSRAVTHGETLTVSYAKPTSGAVVQDAAGNDAANLNDQAVTNSTPASDTTPPVISTATVNGDQLVLSYTEANTLNDATLTGNAGFTVSSSAGTAITVRSAVVDATANTITLTLSRAVLHGEMLSISYAKPASGDDAIQDAAGNDAENFSNQAVNNRTPAPSHRAPGTEDPQESQDIVGPAGSDPGDGNGDGIPDSAQPAVSSFSARTNSNSSTSVTLVADSQEGKVHPSSHARITGLEQKEALAQTPRALETPIALTSFKTTLKTTGSSQTFSLYVDPEIGVNGYWLQDHTDGTWVNLASSPYGGKMVNEGGRLRLDFSITDGGPFDADGQADGVITAPGAAAHMPLSITGQAPDLPPGGLWF
ncbi:SwmB domain-containing protein, partial [Verminephrobacter aporrectodeae]|uniref:SwmB domain-containing protein n=6 Tax=Verminephrobacter aporrectodeae TaxID=1110389 RepID=UPI0022438A34